MSRERIGVGRARSPNLVPVNTESTSQITPRPSRSKGIVQFLRALTSHIFKTDEKPQPPIGYFYEEAIHPREGEIPSSGELDYMEKAPSYKPPVGRQQQEPGWDNPASLP